MKMFDDLYFKAKCGNSDCLLINAYISLNHETHTVGCCGGHRRLQMLQVVFTFYTYLSSNTMWDRDDILVLLYNHCIYVHRPGIKL